MNGRAKRLASTVSLVLVLTVMAGCEKKVSDDAAVDSIPDWSGDFMPDQPDVPFDPAADTTEDGAEVVPDTATDSTSDAAIDTPTDGALSCVCGDTGVVLTADAGCSSWPDATECTGWHSVIDPDMDGSPALTDPFADGSEFCAMSCCITIHC